jgi:diguanylate cyclase (GGDEF)-like protein
LTWFVTSRLTSRLRESRETHRLLSSEDPLTGVGNYRALQERLWQETARHARRNRQFTLLVLDLDGFKAVNETEGHLVGDVVLAVVGTVLGINVRADDTLFRQGGDEFSVLAPETNRAEALKLGARLEDALSEIRVGALDLTVTVATAVFPHDGEDPGTVAGQRRCGAARAQAPPAPVQVSR